MTNKERVVIYLSTHPGASYTDMLASLDINKSTAYAIVNKMVKTGEARTTGSLRNRSIYLATSTAVVPVVHPPEPQPIATLVVYDDHVRLSHADARGLLGG